MFTCRIGFWNLQSKKEQEYCKIQKGVFPALSGNVELNLPLVQLMNYLDKSCNFESVWEVNRIAPGLPLIYGALLRNCE